jgi:hypothetical protein
MQNKENISIINKKVITFSIMDNPIDKRNAIFINKCYDKLQKSDNFFAQCIS